MCGVFVLIKHHKGSTVQAMSLLTLSSKRVYNPIRSSNKTTGYWYNYISPFIYSVSANESIIKQGKTVIFTLFNPELFYCISLI